MVAEYTSTWTETLLSACPHSTSVETSETMEKIIQGGEMDGLPSFAERRDIRINLSTSQRCQQ
jgi:hypothetical protein